MKKYYCKICKSRVKEIDSLIDKRTPFNTSYTWFKAFTNVSTLDYTKHIYYKCEKCNKIYRNEQDMKEKRKKKCPNTITL